VLGHEYLICTDFGPDAQLSLDDWREWADRFNWAGEAARKERAEGNGAFVFPLGGLVTLLQSAARAAAKRKRAI
jgi:hypothetical protein